MSKNKIEEQEWYFYFRGEAIGVMATSKESAYGFMYSEYRDVSKAELDDAYERGNEQMSKVKIKVREWKSEVVEYVCDVDDNDFKKNSCYGISDISTLGDMSNSGGDASGIYCEVISK